MSLISQLRRHATHAVVTWRQRSAARALAPVLYERTLQFASERPKPWSHLDDDEQARWERRALAVLKVAAEQEQDDREQQRERESMDALVEQCYPATVTVFDPALRDQFLKRLAREPDARD